MDPFTLIGGLLGAGGSIAGSLFGAGAEQDAWEWQNYINERNLSAQKKARQEAIDYAEKIRGDQKLGATDALGNRTYFKEGKGWLSELSPEQQALYDYFFGQELPERRSQFKRQAESSRTNYDQAQQLLDQFKRVQRSTPMETENLLYSTASRGIQDATRDATETAMRQATRTGNSNISDIASGIAREAMKQRSNARQDAKIQAADYERGQYNDQRNVLAQLYQMFLGDSNQPLNPSYDPSGLPQQANALMQMFSQQANQGNQMGFQAAMQPAPQAQAPGVNYSSANAAAGIGGALSSLGERLGGMNQKANNNALMKQFLTGGGQTNFGNGGIFGTIASRNRAGSVL